MQTQTFNPIQSTASPVGSPRAKPHIRLRGVSVPATEQEARDARIRLDIQRLRDEIAARGPEPVNSDPVSAPAPRVTRTRAQIAATRAAMEVEIKLMVAQAARPAYTLDFVDGGARLLLDGVEAGYRHFGEDQDKRAAARAALRAEYGVDFDLDVRMSGIERTMVNFAGSRKRVTAQSVATRAEAN